MECFYNQTCLNQIKQLLDLQNISINSLGPFASSQYHWLFLQVFLVYVSRLGFKKKLYFLFICRWWFSCVIQMSRYIYKLYKSYRQIVPETF